MPNIIMNAHAKGNGKCQGDSDFEGVPEKYVFTTTLDCGRRLQTRSNKGSSGGEYNDYLAVSLKVDESLIGHQK
jgi:hypothetical protein